MIYEDFTLQIPVQRHRLSVALRNVYNIESMIFARYAAFISRKTTRNCALIIHSVLVYLIPIIELPIKHCDKISRSVLQKGQIKCSATTQSYMIITMLLR